MLTADQLDTLTNPIADLYERYNQSVINDIARRLNKMGKVTDTAAWQMQRLTESGRVYENALKDLANLTGQSEAELRKAFEDAGVKAMRFDDSIYKAAGLNPLPLNLSPAMVQVLAAGLRKTSGVMKNLTLTTAINAQHSFIAAADLAYMQVASGAMSYDQAIRAAILDVAQKGLSTIHYASGHKDQLDVAVRRTVLTGVSQTTGNLQTARADEMGVDLVQTSAHVGARPDHQVWQGKVFSRSGASKTYPAFVLSTGYGTGAGLCGWNCRHSFYPFFEGISENAYKQAELDSYAAKTVPNNGQDIPIYDATQQQRAIERKIRLWKRQAGALDAAGLDNTAETAKVKEYQAKMRDFIKQTGLQRQSVRESAVFIPTLENLQKGPVTAEQLMKVIAAGKRSLTSDELVKVVDHIADAGFDTRLNVKTPKKFDGFVVNGQALRTGDMISNGYSHHAKHIIEKLEWPTQISYTEYVDDLRKVIKDKQSGIVSASFHGETQLYFLGKLPWSKPDEPILVSYRLSQNKWMTGHLLIEPLDIFLDKLENKTWIRKIQ